MNLLKSVKQLLKKLRWKWHRDLTTALDDDSAAIKQDLCKLLARTDKLEEMIKPASLDDFVRKAEIYRAYSLFEDRESQKLFWARLQLVLNGDLTPILLHLMQSDRKGDSKYIRLDNKGNPKDIIWMLRERIKNKNNKDELIIYGTAWQAKELFLAIRKLGCRVDYICKADGADPATKPFYQALIKDYSWEGVPMITEAELLNKHKTAQVAVSYVRCWEARDYLVTKGFPRSQLWIRQSLWEKQYLDAEIMRPHKHEVYVDGGVYTFENTIEFIEWCKGEYDAVYAFEPDKGNCENCKERLKSNPILDENRIHLLNAALWKKDEVLRFHDGAKGSSALVANGNVEVQGRSIDSVLQGAPVTFIKMDIEGAELDALKGAKESIKKWKPRLAICIYHKPEDSIEIPLYIHGLVPEYKMFIRHYSTSRYETVLYCVCEKDL